jgi:nicotinate-nucleotide pyrophosphorylase (carboxylating)
VRLTVPSVQRPSPPDPSDYRDIVARALAEDLGAGDVTTDATVPPTARARGTLLVKSSCVLAGVDIAVEVFRQIEPTVEARFVKGDGDRCSMGDEVGELVGQARTLLAGERTALNFLQRLSGIATVTRQFVDAAAGLITVLDTRKTTPTLRSLEKYAVRVGGATNHRVGLFDAILIKDNHVRLAGGIAAAVMRVRQKRPDLRIEVEVERLDQLDEALTVGAEVILLDNMSPGDIGEAVRRTAGRARIEISGGVTLERMRALAATGADYVSVGSLTHSAPAADISFEIEPC